MLLTSVVHSGVVAPPSPSNSAFEIGLNAVGSGSIKYNVLKPYSQIFFQKNIRWFSKKTYLCQKFQKIEVLTK